MINASDLSKATQLMDDLRKVQNRLRIVEGSTLNGGFNITISSVYQSDEMVEYMRPHAEQFLKGQIASLEVQLKALGVDPCA